MGETEGEKEREGERERGKENLHIRNRNIDRDPS